MTTPCALSPVLHCPYITKLLIISQLENLRGIPYLHSHKVSEAHIQYRVVAMLSSFACIPISHHFVLRCNPSLPAYTLPYIPLYFNSSLIGKGMQGKYYPLTPVQGKWIIYLLTIPGRQHFQDSELTRKVI